MNVRTVSPGIARALEKHKDSGLIRGWAFVPNAGNGYLAITWAGPGPLASKLHTEREIQAFCEGLASACEAARSQGTDSPAYSMSCGCEWGLNGKCSTGPHYPDES